MGLLFKVSSSSTVCTYTLFFAVRLSRLVLTLCNLEQYEVDTISGDIVKTLHVIVGFLLSVILFANQNFLDDFSNLLYCLVFCLKTLPLSTPLFEETVFEKSQVYNLSRFKISICIWWWFCSGSNIWDNRMSFVRFFWNQLWLSFC